MHRGSSRSADERQPRVDLPDEEPVALDRGPKRPCNGHADALPSVRDEGCACDTPDGCQNSGPFATRLANPRASSFTHQGNALFLQPLAEITAEAKREGPSGFGPRPLARRLRSWRVFPDGNHGIFQVKTGSQLGARPVKRNATGVLRDGARLARFPWIQQLARASTK
jgi:hypothetical protein